MKKLLFILLMVPMALMGQKLSTDTILYAEILTSSPVGVAPNDTFSISLYIGGDQQGQGYSGNMIDTNYVLTDILGRRFYVSSITSQSAGSFAGEVVEMQSDHFVPFGNAAAIQSPMNVGLQKVIPDNDDGITPALLSRFLNHNFYLIDSLLNALDGSFTGLALTKPNVDSLALNNGTASVLDRSLMQAYPLGNVTINTGNNLIIDNGAGRTTTISDATITFARTSTNEQTGAGPNNWFVFDDANDLEAEVFADSLNLRDDGLGLNTSISSHNILAPDIFRAQLNKLDVDADADTTGTWTAGTYFWGIDSDGKTRALDVSGISSPVSGVDGSVQFAASSAHASDGANFFWDNTSKRLGIGNAIPSVAVDVTGDIQSSGQFLSANGSASDPAIANSNDPGNGLYFDAQNNILISTDSTRHFELDSIGRLLMGLANPDLHTSDRINVQMGVIASNSRFTVSSRNAGNSNPAITLSAQSGSAFGLVVGGAAGTFFFPDGDSFKISSFSDAIIADRDMTGGGGTNYLEISGTANTATIKNADFFTDTGQDITSGGQFFGATGSDSAPGYAVTGDANTGWRGDGADATRFVNGGNLTMLLTSGNLVAVGTTTTSANFTASGTNTLAAALEYATSSAGSVSAALRIQQRLSVEATAIEGTAIDWYLIDASATNKQASIQARRSGADNTADLYFITRNAGSDVNVLRMDEVGTVRWFEYDEETNVAPTAGANVMTGALGVNSNGDMVQSMRYRTCITITGGSTTTAAGTPEKIDNDTPGTLDSLGTNYGFDISTTEGRIIYTGTTTTQFDVIMTNVGETDSASETTYILRKNGSTTVNSSFVDLATDTSEETTVIAVVTLATNDYLEPIISTVAAENYTNSKVTIRVRPAN